MVSQEDCLNLPAVRKQQERAWGMKAVGQATGMRRQTVFERMLGNSGDALGFETAVLRRLSFQ